MTAGDMFERGTVWKCTRCGGVALYPFAGNCMATSGSIYVRHHQWEKQ